MHGDSEQQEHPTRTVSYLGALQTALRQLTAWVEDGLAPADDTAYELVDGQIVLAEEIGQRRGVQPVISVTVDGAPAVTVPSGQQVTIRIEAHAPEGGVITGIEADPTGAGALAEAVPVVPSPQAAADRTVTFDAPGTYFVAARVTAQTAGDPTDPHARVHNIGRARITVV